MVQALRHGLYSQLNRYSQPATRRSQLMPTTERTPEEKAAWAKKMHDAKERRKAERAASPSTPPAPSAPAHPDSAACPEATVSVVESSLPAPRHRPARLPRAPVAPPPPAEPYDPSTLIDELTRLPLDAIAYDACGSLINACSSAIAALAAARTRKQEQHLAGTHTVPCTTCSRPIDITKSGGFQILTERDEHFQPTNRYYCSQNCLLARNMPSHRVKRLPGDVGGPQA
jgi:hypothetical protein